MLGWNCWHFCHQGGVRIGGYPRNGKRGTGAGGLRETLPSISPKIERGPQGIKHPPEAPFRVSFDNYLTIAAATTAMVNTLSTHCPTVVSDV